MVGAGTRYVITLGAAVNFSDRLTLTISNPTISTYTRRIDILPGDATDDGIVDFADFVVLSNHFSANSAVSPFADFTGDGVIDFADFIVLSNHFGASLTSLLG